MSKRPILIKKLLFIFVIGLVFVGFTSCDEGYMKRDYKQKDWYKKKHADASDEKTPETPKKEDKGLLAVADFKMKPYPNTEEGKKAEYGEKLVKETYKYFQREDGSNINNQLACASCHINGGTQAYGIPFIGVTKFFPAFMARENEERTIEQRINGCFERSMNGEALDVDSEEMQAMVAYMEHLSQDIKVEGERIKGQMTPDLGELPDRAADLEKGQAVYDLHCMACHMPDGQGMKLPRSDKGYLYPPLWGDDSYNDGAGMHRLLTAAKFIRANMPQGTTHENPLLTVEEAYDVAAYINSLERPVKEGKERDFPDLSKKPKDAPFPPYDDDISQEQHKYGPYNW